MTPEHKSDVRAGLHDTIPITLGYFAVSISLGIAGRAAQLTPMQGFLASWLNFTSTGEFAGFNLIAEQAPYFEMFLMTLIVNARYLLMSASLSQKIPEDTPIWQRCLMAFGVTDEIFGVSILRNQPITIWYSLSVILPAEIGWSSGTAIGILMGNILPERIVQTLGVALFGMFIAVFIPPARKNKVIAGLVVLSFVLSYVFTKVAPLSHLSSGNRIIILTAAIAGLAALFFPVKEDQEDTEEADHA